ncbi:MAG: flagellar type III secretion system protein FliR [Gammaproteobacteria bacterium]|jgi:flagellar biosynthetic protein FliR|nr:flagellar type III secretion system protein FliR [Gammaproteobacteria bacterium]MBP6052159.1 flagellar type III secretion system protein FliR [Pseudomonadales bacterium]MBK6582221.1 flagellar type III secretion system protein FliR [Gammaproteobacteria bacterium]MBK7521505.1 flagellar type III secretion system protein FliR [Gammaproteobacteria bacterium]MBK7729280.1 flagellar type III secretion system protein FliR [Gammaproteobacteria bacterium]
MLELSLPTLSTWLGGYLYPLFRIGAFFMVAPVFGAALVSARIRIGLALLVSVLIAPMIPPVPAIDPLSPAAAVLIAQQVLVGIGIGFVMQIFLHIFVFGAQMVAMQMALGFASMADPANGVSVTVVAQYFLLLLTLVFVATNGHLAMFEILLESFRYLPIGGGWIGAQASWNIANWASWMFLSGLLLALPAVTALLVVNMAFGVMTRAAPQLNVFSLGFPVSMVFGLFVIWASMGGFLPRFDLLSGQAFAMLRELIGAPV